MCVCFKGRIKYYKIKTWKAGATAFSWNEQGYWLNLDFLGQVWMQKGMKTPKKI